MTTTDYQLRLNAILTAALPAQVETDELGNTTPRDEYRAQQLGLLSQEIRRIAWSPEAKHTAHAIAQLADEHAARLLGNVRTQPLPRFESFVSGGHIVPAIQ